MTSDRPSYKPSSLTERVVRRVAIALVLGLAALICGIVSLPYLRAWYYVHKLRSPAVEERLIAANVVAELATHDPRLAEPLVACLLEDLYSEAAAVRLVAQRIAAYAIKHVDGAEARIVRALDQADGAKYLHLAAALRRAGRWRTPYRTVDQLTRLERIRLGSDQETSRLAALQALEQLGPAACALAVDDLKRALSDDAEAVSIAALEAAILCDEATRLEVLDQAAHHVRAGVRLRAAELVGVVQPARPRDLLERLLADENEAVRAAAAFSAGRVGLTALEDSLVRLLGDDQPPEVRARAAWACGALPSLTDTTARVLIRLAEDPDPIVASRAMIAAGRRHLAVADVSSWIAATRAADPIRGRAAIIGLSRCRLSPAGQQLVIESLRQRLLQSLRAGDMPTAVTIMEALAALEDRPYAGVLEDVAAIYPDAPMVRYAAARALALLDPAASVDVFLSLLSSRNDNVRDLAAFSLGRRLSSQTAEPLLLLGLGMDPPLQRGASALALGVGKARGGAVEAETLLADLARRDDPNDEAFEPEELVRGYYLCARLLLGEREVRSRLDRLLLNEHFPRIAIYTTLVLAGDTAPFDLLLLRDGPLDVESLLFDARFVDVLAPILPDAPWPAWYEDEAIRRFQIDRLRDWWRLRRWLNSSGSLRGST